MRRLKMAEVRNKSHEMQVARIQPKGSSSYQYFSLVRQVQILVLFTFKFCLTVSTLFFLSQFSLVVLARIFYPVAQMVICIWKHRSSSSSSSSKGNNRGTLVKPGRPIVILSYRFGFIPIRFYRGLLTIQGMMKHTLQIRLKLGFQLIQSKSIWI